MASTYTPPVMGTSPLLGSPLSNALSCDLVHPGPPLGKYRMHLHPFWGARGVWESLRAPHDFSPLCFLKGSPRTNCSWWGQLLDIVDQMRTHQPHPEA